MKVSPGWTLGDESARYARSVRCSVYGRKAVTITHMVAGYVTDPLEDAIYIPNRLATIAPNTNNNLKTDDKKTTTAIHCDTNNYAHNASPHVVNHKKRHLQGATETYTTRSTRVYSTSLTGTNQTDNISTSIPTLRLVC